MDQRLREYLEEHMETTIGVELFSSGVFYQRADSLFNGAIDSIPQPTNGMPKSSDQANVEQFVESALLPQCLRVALYGNGPTTMHTRVSKGKFETAFGVSHYPEAFVTGPGMTHLPDPLRSVQDHSLGAVHCSSAVLRRTKLLRAAQMLVSEGGLEHARSVRSKDDSNKSDNRDSEGEQIKYESDDATADETPQPIPSTSNSVLPIRSPLDRFLDKAVSSALMAPAIEMPVWWSTKIHDVFLVASVAQNGVLGGIGSFLDCLHKTTSKSTSEALSVLEEMGAGPEEVKALQKRLSIELPSPNWLERRLGLVCAVLTADADMDDTRSYLHLPMFDHGGWPRG